MAIASLGEALGAAERISGLSRTIREVPGLDEGHVERLHSSLLRLIRDYGKRPWWHHRFLVRELDGVALEAKGLVTRGGLSREHTELFDLALYRLRQRRFRTALKILQKMEEPISWLRERERLRGDYRPFRQRLVEESMALEEQLLVLQRVPTPEAGPSEVSELERRVEAYNTASAEAVGRFLSRAPGRDVVRAFLAVAPGLPLPAPPDPEAARELLRLLDGHEGSGELARMDLDELIEASGYSEARFAHLAPGSRRLRSRLNSNASWLRSVSRSAGAVSLRHGDSSEALRQRIPPLLAHLAEIPGAEEAIHHLRALQPLAETGRLEAVQRSARLYSDHGEAARKRWDGTLASEVERKREAIESLRRDLRSLPEL